MFSSEKLMATRPLRFSKEAFKFLAESAGVELGAGGFDFFGWDVAALDGGVAPALPVVGFFFFAEVPQVVEPAGGAVRGADEQGPALFVG